MTKIPRVAVVTRTKDRSIFLKRAVESVARQTYTNYVHVIVNDGGETSVIDRLVEQLPKVQRVRTKVFHRNSASGAPDTIFNESIDRIDSEYFAIHDDDDTWHKDFLKTTVEHLDAHKDVGAVVVKTNKVIEKVVDSTIKEVKYSTWMDDIRAVNLYRQCIDNQMTPIATLYRRAAYEAVGKFDSTLPVVGDWEFGVRLLMQFDVDFIDPGYALAGYHHRTDAKNSFAAHDHRYYTNKVMNTYLRKELASGELGVGYIMSQLKYNEHWTARLIDRVLPAKIVTRLKNKVRN